MPSPRPEISVLLRPYVRSLCPLGLLALVAFLSACSPEIGDECNTALDCSASGTRLCDMTQRGGYCTLEGCEENTCPEEAVCVQFGRRIEGQSVERLARTFCMYKCDSDGDCRTDDKYQCFAARSTNKNVNAFGAGDEAEILGNPNQKFCASPPSTVSLPEPGAGGAGMMSSMPEDAGMMSTPEDAGSMSEDDGGAPSE
jgi:hypothetical protein